MEIALFTSGGLELILRWVHYMAGVTWIGLLYYFNFVQGEWFKETDAGAKSAAVQKLVPRALWWFRWGAMFTFLSGFFILMQKAHMAGMEIFSTSWGILILTGATLGTLMFLNVWLIIWPNQKVVIASAQQVAGGGQAIPEAAQCGAKAGLASRTNVLFSIPMLFFMGSASHLPLSVAEDSRGIYLSAVLAVIIGALEFNGIRGKTGPLTSVKGVIHCGLGLAVVLYAVIEVMV